MAGHDETPRPASDPALPADVPPEFADAYRAAYAEALDHSDPVVEPAAPPTQQTPTTRHRRAAAPSELAALWSETWVKAATAGLVAIALVLAAYGIGKAFSPGGSPSAATSTAGNHAPASPRPARAGPYLGPVRAVHPTGATASCTAAPAVDAGGHPVDYRPANMLDRDPSTAWRCDGSGVGVTLTFALPRGVRVAEVGLVPGYAKTDPVSGADRYAENNRITAVRWTIGDRRVVQHFSADPHDRSLRTIRIPVTSAGTLRLQILASARGPRNTVAISGIRVGTPRG